MSFIREYCKAKFETTGKMCSDDRELIIPSLFIHDDWKRHMSVNLDTGLWRCFKSGETGNFVKLYSLLEKVSYQEAYEKFVFEDYMANGGKFSAPKKITPIDPNKIQSDLEDSEDFEVVENHEFPESRMLFGLKFYLAKKGKYQGRLIIPFINRNGKLFYFQARALGDELPKYLNCKNLKSSQVLYPFDYGSYEPLYVTEGVFDCLSLQAVGLNATTTLSCFTSREQMLQLSQYQGPLVCAFDSDEPGMEGRRKFLDLANWAKKNGVKTVTPSKDYKDWNEMLIKEGPDSVLNSCKKLTDLTHLNLELLAYDKRQII
jgi:hypothetical protein